MTFQVVLTEEIHPAGRRLLEEIAQVDVAPALDEETLAAALRTAEAVVLRARGRLTRRVLARAERLRIIGRYGAGLDNIDLPAAEELGIRVVNTPGANSQSVAEHALACLLALARGLLDQDRAVRAGDWEHRNRVPGKELAGSLLGIVGLGEIGRRVAELCRDGVGMHVAYYDTVRRPEAETSLAAVRMELPELLRAADVVSVHVPLTPGTANLIDRAALGLLKPTAYLLNLARGGVVDELALADALDEGRLAGAAVDVFGAEPPPPDHPLLHCQRALLTPHSAALTEQAGRRVSVALATAVRSELRRHP